MDYQDKVMDALFNWQKFVPVRDLAFSLSKRLAVPTYVIGISTGQYWVPGNDEEVIAEGFGKSKTGLFKQLCSPCAKLNCKRSSGRMARHRI